MANMRYSIKPEKMENVDELKNHSLDAFDSVCDETMVGVKLNPD